MITGMEEEWRDKSKTEMYSIKPAITKVKKTGRLKKKKKGSEREKKESLDVN